MVPRGKINLGGVKLGGKTIATPKSDHDYEPRVEDTPKDCIACLVLKDIMKLGFPI